MDIRQHRISFVNIAAPGDAWAADGFAVCGVSTRLLFLTDTGLAAFVNRLLLSPRQEFIAVKDAFDKSYTGKTGNNRFTKVLIALSADLAMQKFFSSNLPEIETWFNVISPLGRSVAELKQELMSLAAKDWRKILA